MTLSLRFAARSHTGLLRTLNEDSVYAGPRLLAVADGMGGHAAGEVASAVAIAALAPLDEDAPGTDLLGALREAATAANSQLSDMVAADGALQGMGTTLVAILFAGNRLGLLHVGDSRVYLLRDGELSQITHDHTLVQSLVDEGRISAEEATSHPQRSMITRALDGRSDVDPDLSVREVRPGDRYLLCSDGLTGPVGSLDTLREALSAAEPQDAVDRLVQLALKGGGPDNVTVIVADAVEGNGRAASPVVAGAAADAPQTPPPGISDSPASRARTAEGRDVPDEPGSAARAGGPVGRRGRRPLLLGLAGLILLLVLGAAGTFAYARTQYYVGSSHSTVAIFHGVSGSVVGIPLSRVAARTDLSTDALSPLDQDRLSGGIVARDRADAERIVQRLEDQSSLPACASTPASPVPGPSAVAVPTPAPGPTATCGAVR